MNSEKTTAELMRDAIVKNNLTQCKHAETMRRVVAELTARHHIFFQINSE